MARPTRLPRDPARNKVFQTGARLSLDLGNWVKDGAATSGRSVAKHHEMIIQHVKNRQDSLPADLDFLFGAAEHTGATLLLGSIFRDARQNLGNAWFDHFEAGAVVNAAVARTIALLVPGATVVGFLHEGSEQFYPNIDPSPASSQVLWEMRVALCMRPVYQLRDVLVGDRPEPAWAVDLAIIERLTPEQKERIKSLEAMVPERATALAWKASGMTDEAILAAWKVAGMPDEMCMAWVRWLNTPAVTTWLARRANPPEANGVTPRTGGDVVLIDPRRTGRNDDRTVAEPELGQINFHAYLTGLWLITETEMRQQLGRPPQELEIAERITGDGVLRYAIGLHGGPVSAETVLAYRDRLRVEAAAAPRSFDLNAEVAAPPAPEARSTTDDRPPAS